jgi:lipopolysaccharide/colanic/teichoic acid biosynthesis glycosyltransferase
MTDISNRASQSVEVSPLPEVLAPDRYAGRIRWRHAAERSQSGLPCYFAGNWAVLPAVTETRFRALIVKRLIDIVLASLALLVLAPLLVLTALAVKLTSKGPIFFRQRRPGLRGRPFEMLKFRTMYVEAGDASGIRQTTANDSRVTPLGRFLRAKSVDELPQLINVLRGDMSIVGPRPHVEGMLAGGVPYEELVPYYKLRYEMRPGLSGWAQANGLRGPTHDAAVARARIDHDLAYIQNFSLLLDLKIILLTVQREFLTGNGV